MSWNGSNNKVGASPAQGKASNAHGTRHTAPGARHGLVAGLVVVLGGAIAAWFMLSPSSPEAQVTTHKAQGTGKIAEVEPSIPMHVEQAETAEEKPAPKKPEKPIWEQPIPAGLDEVEREVWERKMAYEKRMATDQRLRRYLEKHKPVPSAYKTGTEQVLDWIFNAQIGDVPPPPLPPIPQFELNHIDEILDAENVVSDEDDPDTAARKRSVDEAKAELKRYLAEGGSVENFMEHYRNELVAACELKGMVSSEINAQIDSGEDPEKSIRFIEKANAILEGKGVPAVELTDDQKEILSERLNENDKE